jgi:NAD(P)-dependent dehydrogenase (short-subunit alcohol dehydrogenase family)
METVFSTVADISPQEFRRVTEVTYLGCVYGTMAALKSMRRPGRGRIIQIGSALAYRGIPLQSAYCGAMHALRGFTVSLRTELLHEGSAIRSSIMELPAVNTPQFDWATRVHGLAFTSGTRRGPWHSGGTGGRCGCRVSRGAGFLGRILARAANLVDHSREYGVAGLSGPISRA